LQVLDSQVLDELYGVLSVDTGFFGLTSATNYIPETNHIPVCRREASWLTRTVHPEAPIATCLQPKLSPTKEELRLLRKVCHSQRRRNLGDCFPIGQATACTRIQEVE
jgi:hypothetical protein